MKNDSSGCEAHQVHTTFALCAVKALVIHDGHFLVLSKPKWVEELGMQWNDLPGGRIDYGELSPRDAICRELSEEIGPVKVHVGGPIHMATVHVSDSQHVVATIFACEASSRDVVLSDEHSNYTWLPLDDNTNPLPAWIWQARAAYVKQSPLVYQGMTAQELADAYDVFLDLPDAMSWLQNNRERAAALREELKPIVDVAYGPEPLQKLDIYAPKGAHSAPVVVDVHGGGWTMGSKDPRAICASAMVEQGVVWVPIDYGLAPQYTLEQMIDHVRQAIAWAYHHIAEYGGDPKQLFVTGSSAGGHLTATALMPGWHDAYGLPVDVVKGAIPISGVFDMEVYVHSKGPSQDALELTMETSRQGSPLYHMPDYSLPVIISYGERDPQAFKEQSQAYAQALRAAGCDVTVIEQPEADHFEASNGMSDKDSELFAAVIKMLLNA